MNPWNKTQRLSGHIKKLEKEGTDIQDLNVGNVAFTEPRAMVEVLNSQFSSVFNNKETENNPVPHKNLFSNYQYLSQPVEPKNNLEGWMQIKLIMPRTWKRHRIYFLFLK